MNNAAKLFKDSLASRMAEKGLSQKDLETLSGVPQANISRYRLGKSEPGIGHATSIAQAFGLSLDAFLKDTPTPSAAAKKVTLPEGVREAIREEFAAKSSAPRIPPEFNDLVPQFALLRGERLEYIVRICQAIVNFDDPKLKRVDDLCDEIILGKSKVKEEVKKQA
jgi:transcriptional regulator with XRE-family HTH domain